MGRRWIVILLAGSLALAGCGDDGDDARAAPPDDSATTTATAAAGDWEQLPPSPLSPRSRSVAVWTGHEVLVVGGDTFVCPAGADCELPADPPFSDGAAFDPATGAWRSIAPAPTAFAYAGTAVLGDDVYLLVPGWATADHVTSAFLRYSIAEDRWAELPLPETGAEIQTRTLLAAGDRLLAYRGSDERGELPDLVFDPTAALWTPLPADPLSPSYDRTMVWLGSRVYLFDHALVPQPNSAEPSITRVASFDPATGAWSRLADSDILGTYPWFADGTRLVNPSPGGADGGETNNWGRTVPYGGVYDTATDTWADLTDDDLALVAHLDVADLPTVGERDERVVVAAGADAFVFGGVAWLRDGSEVLGDAWIRRSGSPAGAPAAGG
jgi:hypothetical protein